MNASLQCQTKPCRWILCCFSCVAVLTLLPGCAVKHPPAMKQMVKDTLPPTTAIPDAWTSKDANPGAVTNGWVKSFGDPQLEALVGEVLKNNLNLKAAATRIAVAQNLVIEAHAQMLPLIAAAGSATYLGHYEQKSAKGENKGRFNASSLLAGISWEIDLWGRIRSQTAAAKEEVGATQNDVLYAQESLAGVTAKLWFLATYTNVLLQYAQQDAQLKQQALEIAQAQQSVGQAQEQQVAIALANLETAQSQVTEIRSSLQQIKRGLETLMGRYPGGSLPLSARLDAMPPPLPAGLPVQLLERRPDILSAEHNVNAAFHLIQTAEAARLPSLTLTSGAGYLTNEIYQKLAFRPWVWTVGANLAAPLYTGGFLKAEVNVAKENQKAALAIYGATILQAFDDVEVSLTNERDLRDEHRQLSAVVENVDRALALEKIKFQVGQVDMGPVLQLEESGLGASAAASQIQYELLANRVNLNLALGATP